MSGRGLGRVSLPSSPPIAGRITKQGCEMARRAFDQAELDHWDALPVLQGLAALGLVWVIDETFKPRKDPMTQRLNVSVGPGVIELLANDAKWYDTRARKGGTGAITLAMHLCSLSFVSAVTRLKRGGPPAGRMPRVRRHEAGRAAMV